MACAPMPNGMDADTVVLAEDGSLEIEATIQRFLADSLLEALELPRLSTSQRRKARQLAEQHAELTCESFGLAADRRLHLFKRSRTAAPVEVACAEGAASHGGGSRTRVAPAACVLDAVSVKNTFIDGWLKPEEDLEAEMLIRSMPVAMPGGLLRLCSADDCELSLGERSPGEVSTCASDVEVESSPPKSLPELRASPADLSVRNTFIHFEALPVDERAVQSMPHGMFGELLLAEHLAEQGTAQHSAMAVPSAPAAAAPTELAPGTEVRIEGLVKAPAFNGLSGAVQSLDAESGRYNVLLTVNGRQQKAQLKGENLVIVALPLRSRPAPLVTCGMEDSSETSFPPTPEFRDMYPWMGAPTWLAAAA